MNSVGDVFGDVFGEVDFKITIYAPDVDFYLCFHQNKLVGKVSFFSIYPDKGDTGGFLLHILDPKLTGVPPLFLVSFQFFRETPQRTATSESQWLMGITSTPMPTTQCSMWASNATLSQLAPRI